MRTRSPRHEKCQGCGLLIGSRVLELTDDQCPRCMGIDLAEVLEDVNAQNYREAHGA